MGSPARLAPEQRNVLARLRALPELDQVYLAGGSGIAVHLGHALLEAPELRPGDIPVASLRDLAASKLSAIAKRGLRRDFWDSYAMHHAGLSLAEQIAAYRARYGAKQPDIYHVLRSLTYFDDAEREQGFPMGMTPELWRTIKDFFRRAAPLLIDAG